jgi:leucyl-tRNA synthetase
MHKEYDHKTIEKKWQEKWQEYGIYKTSEDVLKPKKYILDMFPYPSGAGLHVGHPKGYIATDILSRMYRMQGFNVLHPMGWDAFGLPAEQFAIKNQIHPKIAVDKNVKTYKRQLQMIGLDYDWSREVNTTDPQYYKWTQWVFLQMFKKGLAFESYEPINWCPSCKTGLANEDLEDGKCERCGSEIEQKPLRQWVLRITDYAEALLADLDTLDKWPDSVKTSQRNWIGKSEGAEIEFKIKNHQSKIKVFTTRPDTLFGATYVVLAPESHLVHELKNSIQNWHEVSEYIEEIKKKPALERQKNKEKTGVELRGILAINPANGEDIPVWIADYVLVNYGTGAVMAVPAHDERDFEFAKKYNLSIKEVVSFYYEGVGDSAPQQEKETLNREVVDVIIENEKGEFLLIKENANNAEKIHFVGGGTEGEDELEALKKEIKEETGYIDFEIIEKIPNCVSAFAFRHTKLKNQNTYGYFFHVKLKSENRIASEVEEGKHSLMWVKKEEVKNLINWPHHLFAWEMFLKKERVFSEFGVLINSNQFNGLTSEEAKQKITEFVGGKMKTTYKLQDWVFSRQRYWGEPIPLVHAGGKVYPLAESQLPLQLPEVERYEPSDSGESPLADIADWVNVQGSINDAGEFVVSDDGEIEGRRETNTMPQWAGSCWYYLRYIDPKNNEVLVNANLEQYWMGGAEGPEQSRGIDVYVGGMEHATRHLIYARFWHKFLFDIGVVSTTEPFSELHAPGLILAEDGRKMSKRWGNVVNPDEMVDRFGADAFRLYEAFMGPFDDAIAWNTDGVVGTRRFVERVVRIGENFIEQEAESVTRELHKLIKKVSSDIPTFKFNTSVSSMMSFINTVEKEGGLSKESFITFLKLLAPFAPHITEELWRELGNTSSIHTSAWPQVDESKLIRDTVEIVVQVNGKLRARIEVAFDAVQDDVYTHAMQEENVQKFVERAPKKIIFVPNKILNIVM